MDQKYVITRLVLGSGAVNEIGLSETEFNTLKAARIGLRQAHSVEEKFDIVMEDYIELETDLLCQTTRNVFFLTEQLGNSMTAFRFRLNRRLLHLLVSIDMYLDQTRHDFSTLFGKSSEELSHFDQARHHEYENVFGYQVCQDLRDFSAHRSFPALEISYASSSRQEDGICNHTIDFSLYSEDEEIQGDKKFKTRKKLIELGQKYIPLKPLLREYVSSIGRVHRTVREILAPAIRTWEADSREAVERFCAEFGNNIRLLAIARIRLENGREQGVLESHYLNDKPSERRKQLERKNAQLNDVAAHRISSL